MILTNKLIYLKVRSTVILLNKLIYFRYKYIRGKKVTERKRKLNNWRQDKNYHKIKSEIINQLFEYK